MISVVTALGIRRLHSPVAADHVTSSSPILGTFSCTVATSCSVTSLCSCANPADESSPSSFAMNGVFSNEPSRDSCQITDRIG